MFVAWCILYTLSLHFPRPMAGLTGVFVLWVPCLIFAALLAQVELRSSREMLAAMETALEVT